MVARRNMTTSDKAKKVERSVVESFLSLATAWNSGKLKLERRDI